MTAEHGDESAFYRMAAWPARRPWTALAVALLLAAVALLGVHRIEADSSIESMVDRNDPAASAMVRVLHQFSAVEDLLVLVTVPGDEPSDADTSRRLIAYAQRLEAAVAASQEARDVAEAVIYRPDEQSRAFVEKVLVPAGLYYLDDVSFEAARQRLTRKEMSRQIARNEAMISAPGPAADALASALLQDPLRLHEFLLSQFNGKRGFGGADAFLSPDGRSLLIRVVGKGSPGDIDFAKTITMAIGGLAQQVNHDRLEIDITGAYAIAAASERAIRGDMIASVVSSIILLQILFIAAYRRPIRSFFLAFAPVALGILYGFGGYSLFSASISPATAVVGAILAGLGIDYSVHYLSHYLHVRAAGDLPVRAVGHTSVILGPSLLAACVTSVIGFLAVGTSHVQALREFSLIGSLGLLGALLAAIWIVPAILGLSDRGHRQTTMRVRTRVETLLHLIARHRRAALAISASLLLASAIVIATADEILPLESDLTVMHPRPNPPLDAQAKIARRMGADPVSLLVHLRANDQRQLLELAHHVDRQLRTPAAQNAGVAGTFGLATLLPDPQQVSRRRAAVPPEEADRIVADFRTAIADSAFSTEAYEPYAGFLQRLLDKPTAPTIADLVPYRRLAETILSRSNFDPGLPQLPEAITLVFLDRPLDQRSQRTSAISAVRDALKNLPGATLTGLSVIQFDTERAIHRDLPRLLLFAGVLVAAYLLIFYRNLTDVLLASLPTIFSLTLLLAFMRLANQDLNLMNLIAIPLLIGIDIDYGIFLVSLARRSLRDETDLTAGIASSGHAIGVSAISTIFGFGSLIGTSVPAIRSLGWAVGVGVAACLAGTLFLLAPILIARSLRRHNPHFTQVSA